MVKQKTGWIAIITSIMAFLGIAIYILLFDNSQGIYGFIIASSLYFMGLISFLIGFIILSGDKF